MSKIKINAVVKQGNKQSIFQGKGIKTKNKITYNDNGIMTTIYLNNDIILERKKDYFLKLGFKTNKNIKGTYIINERKLNIETFTKEIKREKNSIKIKYRLMINNALIDTFEFYLRYTIDTK